MIVAGRATERKWIQPEANYAFTLADEQSPQEALEIRAISYNRGRHVPTLCDPYKSRMNIYKKDCGDIPGGVLLFKFEVKLKSDRVDCRIVHKDVTIHKP